MWQHKINDCLVDVEFMVHCHGPAGGEGGEGCDEAQAAEAADQTAAGQKRRR